LSPHHYRCRGAAVFAGSTLSKKILKKNMLKEILLICWIVTATPVTHAAEQMLPLRLQILQFDPQLNAFLLSGDFSNPLAKPLRAWRGELRLKDISSDEVISFFFEHQAKRPVNPGEVGVWSFWLNFKPEVAEHAALKRLTVDTLEAGLRLIRVLYADGSQEAF
jgi:hypothetical protein